MNEVSLKENIKIENMIYEIRGKQVMLDSDLAQLYGVLTGNLNKAVKRNIERFPNYFMFQLNESEYKSLMFQSGISNRRGGNRKLPYAFTEQGVAMLSSVLHTEAAINISINIINAFISMRHYYGNSLNRLSNIETKIIEHDTNIKLLQESFNKLEKDKEVKEIYFNGKIYDAYSKIIDIFNEAKKEYTILDNEYVLKEFK